MYRQMIWLFARIEVFSAMIFLSRFSLDTIISADIDQKPEEVFSLPGFPVKYFESNFIILN